MTTGDPMRRMSDYAALYALLILGGFATLLVGVLYALVHMIGALYALIHMI
jgi:hypothetical protein